MLFEAVENSNEFQLWRRREFALWRKNVKLSSPHRHLIYVNAFHFQRVTLADNQWLLFWSA
ncbi:MAG TPA: hypothetical protein DEP88_00015 [Verrucomicrobiales bacterium]|jgi:hypothetical protein|nr:hypothetical protein [Verrucomicrobiales bacterium]HCL97109.1 hypothetical protein [Verrucomicrobiales bacterium]